MITGCYAKEDLQGAQCQSKIELQKLFDILSNGLVINVFFFFCNNYMPAIIVEESPDIPGFLHKLLWTNSIFLIIETKCETMSFRGEGAVQKDNL